MLRRLWNIAPVFTTNLLEEGLVDKTFNESLSRAAVAAFDNYVTIRRGGTLPDHRPAQGDGSGDDGSSNKRRRRRNPSVTVGGVTDSAPKNKKVGGDGGGGGATQTTTDNDHFFEHQRIRGYHLATESIANSAEATELHAHIVPDIVATYLREGINTQRGDAAADLLDSGFLAVDLWAAVQRGVGAHHPDHVHEGAIVSGVYYASIPEGSAPLMLRRPPSANCSAVGNNFDDHDEEFDKDCVTGDVSFRPREGQLILFPPWLHHGVPLANEAGNKGTESARVSFAFNVTGAPSLDDPWGVTRISDPVNAFS